MPKIEREFQREVYCTLEVEGMHSWPGCPYDEVGYLRDPHRHVFGIKAYALVSHGDRDIEFIMLKHKIRNYLVKTYWSEPMQLLRFGARSCEMIAEELIEQFDLSKCEVNEDGENGSIITVTSRKCWEASLDKGGR